VNRVPDVVQLRKDIVLWRIQLLGVTGRQAKKVVVARLKKGEKDG
jgi:hypothetical protein